MVIGRDLWTDISTGSASMFSDQNLNFYSKNPDFSAEIQPFTFLSLDAIIFTNMEQDHD